MVWPVSDVTTTSLDAGTDSPQTARTHLLDLAQKFNELRNHFSTYMRGLATAADAAAARTTLGGTATGSALFTATDAAAARTTLGGAAAAPVATGVQTTPGGVFGMGWGGLGGAVQMVSDWNAATVSGALYGASSVAANTPIPNACVGNFIRWDTNTGLQRIYEMGTSVPRCFVRIWLAGTWHAWFELPAGLLGQGFLGGSQTLQNVTGSRGLNTTYTNTTGRPMAVHFAVSQADAFFAVGGINVLSLSIPSGFAYSGTGAVPPGETYRLNSSAGSLASWHEYR